MNDESSNSKECPESPKESAAQAIAKVLQANNIDVKCIRRTRLGSREWWEVQVPNRRAFGAAHDLLGKKGYAVGARRGHNFKVTMKPEEFTSSQAGTGAEESSVVTIDVCRPRGSWDICRIDNEERNPDLQRKCAMTDGDYSSILLAQMKSLGITSVVDDSVHRPFAIVGATRPFFEPRKNMAIDRKLRLITRAAGYGFLRTTEIWMSDDPDLQECMNNSIFIMDIDPDSARLLARHFDQPRYTVGDAGRYEIRVTQTNEILKTGSTDDHILKHEIARWSLSNKNDEPGARFEVNSGIGYRPERLHWILSKAAHKLPMFHVAKLHQADCMPQQSGQGEVEISTPLPPLPATYCFRAFEEGSLTGLARMIPQYRLGWMDDPTIGFQLGLLFDAWVPLRSETLRVTGNGG